MAFPIVGIVIGVIIGYISPYTFPSWASQYVAIAILACADTVLGGLVAIMEKKFHMGVFITGFFTNAILSAALVWLGNQLSIDISIAAVVVFGSRMFQNFANIRRFLLNKHEKNDNI